MQEKHLLEELKNIVEHYPLFPGDTISHSTANECIERGWATRSKEGNFLPTKAGIEIFEKIISES